MIRHALAGVLLLTATITSADAQVYGPFPSQPTTIPLPAPTPLTPRGTVQPPTVPALQPPAQSFGDRVTQCMQYGAAIGYGPNDLSGYTRACTNSQ